MVRAVLQSALEARKADESRAVCLIQDHYRFRRAQNEVVLSCASLMIQKCARRRLARLRAADACKQSVKVCELTHAEVVQEGTNEKIEIKSSASQGKVTIQGTGASHVSQVNVPMGQLDAAQTTTLIRSANFDADTARTSLERNEGDKVAPPGFTNEGNESRVFAAAVPWTPSCSEALGEALVRARHSQWDSHMLQGF